jgi:hypothetical protein
LYGDLNEDLNQPVSKDPQDKALAAKRTQLRKQQIAKIVADKRKKGEKLNPMDLDKLGDEDLAKLTESATEEYVDELNGMLKQEFAGDVSRVEHFKQKIQDLDDQIDELQGQIEDLYLKQESLTDKGEQELIDDEIGDIIMEINVLADKQSTLKELIGVE